MIASAITPSPGIPAGGELRRTGEGRGEGIYKYWPPLLLGIIILAIYWPVAKAQFVDWDDWQLLAQNPDFLPVNWAKIASYWIHGRYELYSPLSYTLWAAIAWAEQQFTHHIELSAGPFHIANLLLHLGAAEIVFLFLRRLINRTWPAFVGALVFAIHPLQIEAVAWVSSLNTVLSVFLSIVATWLYVRYAQSGSWKWFVLSCLALVLALFSKPMAVPAVAIALLIEFTILRRRFRQYLLPISIWAAITIPFLILSRLMQPAVVPSQTPLWMRPLIALDSFSFYLAKIVWPFHLAIDYQRTPFWVWSSGRIWFTWLLLPLAILLIWRLFPQRRNVFIGLAILLLALFPTSGVVGFAFQRYSTVADRYAYLGIAGIGFAVAAIAASKSPKLFCSIALPIFLIFAVRDITRINDWHDTLALTAAAESPLDACATDHRIRAFALARVGRNAEARVQYLWAISYDPTDADTYYDFANLLYRTGQIPDAIEAYQRAISIQPARGEFHHNYAIALMSIGKADRAGQQFQLAAQLSPDSPEAQRDYAKWLRMRKN